MPLAHELFYILSYKSVVQLYVRESRKRNTIIKNKIDIFPKNAYESEAERRKKQE